MKQPKKLTRLQKKIVSNHHLNPDEYACVNESEFYITIINKTTHVTKRLDKLAHRF